MRWPWQRPLPDPTPDLLRRELEADEALLRADPEAAAQLGVTLEAVLAQRQGVMPGYTPWGQVLARGQTRQRARPGDPPRRSKGMRAYRAARDPLGGGGLRFLASIPPGAI